MISLKSNHMSNDLLAKVMCIHPNTGKSKQWKGPRFCRAARQSNASLGRHCYEGTAASCKMNQRHGATPHLTEKAHHDTNILCRRIGLVHLQNNTQSVGDPTSQTRTWFFLAWVEATRPSNNAGELTAMVFALMSAYCRFNHMNITIAYDSTYAASCTQGIWAPNQAAQHWLCLYQTTFYVSFRYVAADTSLQDWGSINNEAADAAVKSHSSRLDVYRHSIRTCATTPTSHCLAATVKTLPGRHSTVHSGEQQNLPSSRQAPNSTITDGQYSNNAKRGAAEEQDAYNKFKTYKDHSNNGPDDSGHRDLCAQLDEEMRLQDAGPFYELLRKLGVNIQGKTYTGQDPFRLEETTQFGEQVGDGNYEPPAHMHQLLPPQQDIAWEYGLSPDEQEVIRALHKMKDSNGTDKITAGWLRLFGVIAHTHTVIQPWNTEPHSWDKSIHEVIGFLLKKHKGARQDLSNHRCIQLINVLSRLFSKWQDTTHCRT